MKNTFFYLLYWVLIWLITCILFFPISIFYNSGLLVFIIFIINMLITDFLSMFLLLKICDKNCDQCKIWNCKGAYKK